MSSTRSRVTVAAVATAVLVTGLLTGASAAATRAPGTVAGGTWGTAQEVPGLAALSQGRGADLRSVSCGSAGNCSAVGSYATAPGHGQAYVVNQTNGTWRTAQTVPGLAALNQGGSAGLVSVSCASAGNCSAGGDYLDGARRVQAFVVSEANGIWRTAQAVPGLAVLNAGGVATILSVSCASAGNCAAGGYYHDSLHHQQVFAVRQVNGTWGTAQEVPGSAALNRGGFANLFSVSCGAPGNCSAGGYYLDASNRLQAFVVSETNGTWGRAEEVPGTAALDPNGSAVTPSVSCPAAGDCTAGGSAGRHAFVATETNGTWGSAEVVPGLAALNNGRAAEVVSVSCAAAGNCSAGGDYVHGTGQDALFVATETNGTWGTAEEVPGTAALNKGGNALIDAVSCGSAGNCGTGGYYQDGAGHLEAFVASEANGTWRTAQEVPGIAALNQGGIARVWFVSCASAAHCGAGGIYTDGAGHLQAFVVTETTGA